VVACCPQACWPSPTGAGAVQYWPWRRSPALRCGSSSLAYISLSLSLSLIFPCSFSPCVQEQAELTTGQNTLSASDQIQIATTKTTLTYPYPHSTSSCPSHTTAVVETERLDASPLELHAAMDRDGPLGFLPCGLPERSLSRWLLD
jgi:hypothetical protein